jgi:hypothetical protein
MNIKLEKGRNILSLNELYDYINMQFIHLIIIIIFVFNCK